MTSRQKTSVRASAKPTNRSSTPASPAGARDEAPPTLEEANRLAERAAAAVFGPAVLGPAPEATKGKAKRGKAARAGTPPDAGQTGAAYADDGKLKVVSIPTDGPAGEVAPEPKPGRNGRKPKAAKEPKARKLSGLDAAALVLAESKTPMKAVDMLAEIHRRSLWASNGRTPEATLYAAIIREIAAKGRGSRFKKHGRGLFAANGKGA